MSKQFNPNETKAELEQYLSTKDLNPILVDVVEHLLVSKPQNPHVFIVRYFLENFPEETKEIRLQLNAGGPRRQSVSQVTNESDSSNHSKCDDGDDEESDDDSVEKNEEVTTSRIKNRRRSVCSERLDSLTCDYSVIPNNPKPEEECRLITKALQSNILFKHLDEDQLRPVHSAMSLIKKNEGDVIIKQGDDGDNFYAIKDGTVDIFISNHEEDKIEQDGESNSDPHGKLVKQCSVGECFGELAILYNAPRAATCIATSNVELWALDRVSFKLILMSTAIAKNTMRVHFLEQVPILGQLTQEEIYTIAESMQEESFKKNDVIFNEGDTGNKFYIIKEGVAICITAGQLMARLEKGAYFGEIALLTPKPRQATVVVESENITCLTLDRFCFDRVMGPLKNILMRNMEEYNKFQAEII